MDDLLRNAKLKLKLSTHANLSNITGTGTMGEVVLATEPNVDQQLIHTDHEAKPGGLDCVVREYES